ncbi:hypothetical protein E4U30_001187 [Claviceps sp. LM220 group G6]|nr:hypothetical protein E4U30_001187 [Claviceps sp. LM220 group G6]
MLMAVLQQALREMAVETPSIEPQSANRETFNIIRAVNEALDRDDAMTARRLRSGDANEMLLRGLFALRPMLGQRVAAFAELTTLAELKKKQLARAALHPRAPTRARCGRGLISKNQQDRTAIYLGTYPQATQARNVVEQQGGKECPRRQDRGRRSDRWRWIDEVAKRPPTSLVQRP